MIPEPERFRLLGSYATPPFNYGDMVECEVRGECVLVGLTSAPVPWPVAKRPGRGQRQRFLPVYGALTEAVRREAARAVAHHWGVTPATVSQWRKALGVGPVNEGTSRLARLHANSEPVVEGRMRGAAKPVTPPGWPGRPPPTGARGAARRPPRRCAGPGRASATPSRPGPG